MAYATQYDALDLFEHMVNSAFRPRSAEPARAKQAAQPAPVAQPQECRLIRMDVAETDQAYRIVAELPGIQKEDVAVTIDSNRVLVEAQGKAEKQAEGAQERCLLGERFHGKWTRRIQLAEEVDDAAAEAKFADGLLTLTLPKKQPRGVRKLAIQ